jgi:hypothetical protein
MHGGGSEPIEVRDHGGHAELHISALPGIKALTDIQDARPYNLAVNPSGKKRIDELGRQLVIKRDFIAEARIRDGKINRLMRRDLDAPVGAIVAGIASLGRQMQIPTLARAKKIEYLPRETLKFKCNPVPQPDTPLEDAYRRIFFAEMYRQLHLQQVGLNKLTLDRWLQNIALFRMDQKVFLGMDRDGRRAALEELRKRAIAASEGAQWYLGTLLRRKGRQERELAVSSGIDAEYERAESLFVIGVSRVEVPDFVRRQEDLEKLNHDIAHMNERIRIIREAAHSVDAAIEADDRDIIVVPDREVLDPLRDPLLATEESRRRWRTRLVGRLGNERKFRKRIIHYLDKLRAAPARPPRVSAVLPSVPEWTKVVAYTKDIAVLHNPDQVAGGYDRFPKLKMPRGPVANTPEWRYFFNRLFDCIGLSVVNSQIGFQWDDVLTKKTVARIQKSIPAVAHFIHRLNFYLFPDPPNP